MIELRKDEGKFELISWINDVCGIIYKLNPQSVSKLKANLDIATESLKAFVDLSADKDLAVENLELKEKLRELTSKYDLLMLDLAEAKKELDNTRAKVRELKQVLKDTAKKQKKSFFKRLFRRN